MKSTSFQMVCFAWTFIALSACASAPQKVLPIETPNMPLVRAALYFPFGSGDESTGQEGATLLLTRWMDFGTQSLTTTEFNQKLLGFGATLDTSVYQRYTLVSVEAPSSSFDQAWTLALEKIKHPNLAAGDLETARQGTLGQKQNRLMNWAVAGKQLALAAIYAGTADGHADVGLEESLEKMSPQSLREYYNATFKKGPALVLVSKTISPAQAKRIKGDIEGWHSPFKKTTPLPHQVKGRHLVIVERPGSSQAYLFFAKYGPAPGTEDHALVSVATQLLGGNGGNSSILFDELRAKRGLTYHASLQTSKLPNRQYLLGATFGSNEKIGELASLYLTTWKNFYAKTDMPETELLEADIAYRALRDRGNGETIAELMDSAAMTFSVTGDVQPVWKKPAITLQSFNEAKDAWLEPDNFVLVVLGDPAQVRIPLEKALSPLGTVTILPPNSDWDAVSAAVSTGR